MNICVQLAEGWGEGPEALLKGLWRAERFGEAFDLVFTQEAMKHLHPIAKLIFQDHFHFKDTFERPDHLVPLRIDVLLVERGAKLYRPLPDARLINGVEQDNPFLKQGYASRIERL